MLINPYVFGPQAWTPAQLTTSLWLDAADSSTITTVSGAVSQWNDKSGNGRNAVQSTSTKRPLYESNQFNGLSAIKGDGVDDVLTIASTPMYNQSSFYIHAVIKRLETGRGIIAGNRNSLGGSLGVRNFEFAFFGPATLGIRTSSIFVANGPGINQNSAMSSPTNSFVNGLFAQTAVQWQTGANPTVWIDGLAQSLAAWDGGFNSSQLWQSPDPGLGIMDSSVAYDPAPAQMQMCEIVIVNSVLSSINRQKTEGYLAHKWGLTASLPADHPYKSAAPTV